MLEVNKFPAFWGNQINKFLFIFSSIQWLDTLKELINLKKIFAYFCLNFCLVHFAQIDFFYNLICLFFF